jgi:hypothetical protein
MPYDPVQQVNLIKQVLAQNKASVGFLIAAGCGVAVDKLIPNVEGLTEAIREKLLAGNLKSQFNNVRKQFDDDGRPSPNVEDLLSHIRALKEVVGSAEVRGLTKKNLEDLESQICSIVADLVNKDLPPKNTPHHYLAHWISSAPRINPVEIFTTNYDLLLEQAFEDVDLPCFDGFVGARQAFFDLTAIEQDKLPSRWARLWKLHGSINWRLIKKGNFDAVIRTHPADTTPGTLLIHPSHLKYDQSRRMPYLAMMDRLRSFMNQKQPFLVICGYSFGDRHINEAIAQGLKANPHAAAFALQFGKLDEYSEGVALAEKTATLSFLADDGAVLGTNRDQWKVIPKDDSCDTAPEIEWLLPTADSEIKHAHLKLGNFRVLGKVLQGLINKKELFPDVTSEEPSNE